MAWKVEKRHDTLPIAIDSSLKILISIVEFSREDSFASRLPSGEWSVAGCSCTRCRPFFFFFCMTVLILFYTSVRQKNKTKQNRTKKKKKKTTKQNKTKQKNNNKKTTTTKNQKKKQKNKQKQKTNNIYLCIWTNILYCKQSFVL